MISTPQAVKKTMGDITNRTPSRRSLFGFPQTPVEIEKENDDLERRHRRSMVHLQKRMSSIKAAAAPPDSPNPQVEEKELKMHFDICLKMFSENKINAKNVWNLRIIDILKQIVQTNTISRDSLQVGSVSLDVSAKVYGIRVDDVHAEGLKLASNMARIETRKENDGGEQEDDNLLEEGHNENRPVEKKKRKRRCKNTLVTNGESLFGDVPKIKSCAFQTNTNAELSAIDNYFTNSLPTDCTQSRWVLSEQVKAYEVYENPDPSLILTNCPLRLSTLTSFDMCRDFLNFEVDNWDPESDDIKLQDSTLNENVLVFDNAGVPVPELDGSVHDLFADADAVSSADEEEEEIAQLGVQEVANICDVMSLDEESTQSNEYLYASFFHPTRSITNLWAGPSHWKMKHIRRTQSRYSGVTSTNNVAQQPAKKRAKVVRGQSPIRFDEDTDEELPHFGKNRKFVKSATDDKFLLPPNYGIDDEFFLKLGLKEGYITDNKKKAIQDKEQNDIDIAPYNYENCNDSKYCTENHDDYDDDNGAQDGINGEIEMMVNGESNVESQQQQFVGQNLIDLPELVPKTQIQFALKAKKMDMKKLKLATWKVLVQDNSNDIINPNIFEKDVVKTEFVSVYKILPSLISSSMKEELSPHLAFVAMLHLANEHCLKFTPFEDKFHFTIEKDKGCTVRK